MDIGKLQGHAEVPWVSRARFIWLQEQSIRRKTILCLGTGSVHKTWLSEPAAYVTYQGSDHSAHLDRKVRRREWPQVHPAAYRGHLDPVLHHLGPVCFLRALIPKAGGNDTCDNVVYLSENVINGGCQMLLSLLVLLRAGVAQAVVGQYFLQ
jgi:hypothetical protein